MFRYGYLGEDPVNGTDPIGRGAWLDAVGLVLAIDQPVYDWIPNNAVGYNRRVPGFH